MVIARNEVPLVRQDVLSGLGYSQDMFVSYVVFTLPLLDLSDVDGSISSFLDELISDVLNIEESLPEWVGFLYDEYYKVAYQLSKYTFPYLDNISSMENVFLEGLSLTNSPQDPYYVIEFEIYTE
jgi:hypothetical protein